MLSDEQRDAVVDLYEATQAYRAAWEQQVAALKEGDDSEAVDSYHFALAVLVSACLCCSKVSVRRATVEFMLNRYLPYDAAAHIGLGIGVA